jgi:hypothetical protein
MTIHIDTYHKYFIVYEFFEFLVKIIINLGNSLIVYEFVSRMNCGS